MNFFVYIWFKHVVCYLYLCLVIENYDAMCLCFVKFLKRYSGFWYDLSISGSGSGNEVYVFFNQSIVV